jgi:polar amino acid transport system substrate-binding protein
MHKSVNCFKYFFSLVLIGLINFQLYAQVQDSLITTKTIKIGLKDAPPFVMQNDRGEYEGISLESWNMVNEQLQVHFEYEYYETLEGLLQAVEDGDVDMSINPVTVTKHRMQQMDFSQPYFISETTVAKKKESSIMNFLNNIISWQFFSAIALLVSVILIFGFLIWLFERKRNHEEFGGTLKGIGQGFWWSAVTMTTVGYGDKAPKTLGGRVIGFIWMFLAIILISSLTAGIASSLTVQSMHNTVKNVNDLNKFEVTTISKSSADEFYSDIE